MCGFTGIISKNGDAEALKNAVQQSLAMIHHRGPDYQQYLGIGALHLGHARLSILDTSKASNQPFQSADGRYTLCFNGEIYNYKSLRQSLIEKGVDFRSEGDTEVLIQCLIHHGLECLEKLNGFFAFAFYDHELDSLILARDRMGQKPLLYSKSNGQLCFASELSALKPYLTEFKPDFTALSFYMQLGYIPAPHSAIEGVQKMMPGEYLICTKGKSEKGFYFELDHKLSNQPQSTSDFVELMDDSVKLRLISDRPLGCFLSGGIDSSIITALASKHHDKLNTFSIGFDNNPYLDESKYAADLAKSLGTIHHRIGFESKSVLERVTNMLDSLSEPFADSSAIAYYALSEYTRKEVVVALSGDGADELFAGYRKHLALNALSSFWIRNALKFAPTKEGSRENQESDRRRKIGRLSKAARLDFKERYWLLASFAPEPAVQLLKQKSSNYQSLKSEMLNEMESDSIQDVLLMDQKLVLPNDMLHKADSMSMAHGLEVRSPFMDYRVVDFANKLSAKHKISYQKGKLILRESFKNILPAEVWTRPKKGFEVPLESMLKNELQALIEEYLSEKSIESLGVFNAQAVGDLLNNFKLSPNAQSSFSIWSILVAQYWFSSKG